MEKRTWITVGAAGTLGLGLVAAGALATANAMDVDDTTQVAQGGVVLGSAFVEKQGVTIRVTDGHASVVSAPTASSVHAPSNSGIAARTTAAQKRIGRVLNRTSRNRCIAPCRSPHRPCV